MNVVFIIFNRPELTFRVFERIRKAQPEKLFLIADGPRSEEERGLCEEARSIVHKVDWECELRTNFSDLNLGCGARPATGLDWVFSKVEEAIILEDDCLPSRSFFTFCERLLERYRKNEKIMHIGATNYLGKEKFTPYSYYFSRYIHGAAWATWRRAWQHFDISLKSWPEKKSDRQFRERFSDRLEFEFWAEKFDYIYGGVEDIWDYQWLYACWANNGLAITPVLNLVENLGFGPDATHTIHSTYQKQNPAMDFSEIRHPTIIEVNEAADRYTFNNHHGGDTYRKENRFSAKLGRRLKNKIKRVMGGSLSEFRSDGSAGGI